MHAEELVVCFIGIVACLGAFLVWALYEVEERRQRRYRQTEWLRSATRFVLR